MIPPSSLALAAILVVGGTVLPAAPLELDPNSRPSLWSHAHSSSVDISGLFSDSAVRTESPVGHTGADHMQRMRAPVCPFATLATGDPIPCPGDPVVPLPECGDAATLPPLWERPVPDSTPAPWTLIGTSACASPADVTPAMVLAAFRRLPLSPSDLVVQPDRGWVLLNKPTVVHAGAGPQTLTTTILGTDVAITATPTNYAWDFGDGATLTTTDPGLPWPDGTLTHTYLHAGEYRLALTTTWSATYTVTDDPAVRDVPGTATTTSAVALSAQERRSHLVGSTCADDSSAPGC